jgi:hypothetical protein
MLRDYLMIVFFRLIKSIAVVRRNPRELKKELQATVNDIFLRGG